jgi:hypothetical protein
MKSAEFDKEKTLLMTSTSALFIHRKHFKSPLLLNTHFAILSIRHNDSTKLDAYLPCNTLPVIITSLIPIYTLEMGFYYINQANFVS